MSKSSNDPQALNIIQPVPGDNTPASTRLAASIFATMLYPLKQEHESKRLATAYTLALRQTTFSGSDKGLDTNQWAGELIATRGQMIQVFRLMETYSIEEVKSQQAHGLVAGEVLSLIVWTNLDQPGEASLKKAFFLAEQIYRFGVTGASGSQRRSQKTIKRIWAEFWTVAHLWAGFAEIRRMYGQIAKDKGDSEEEGWRTAFWSVMNDPSPLIAYATNYLRCVTNHVPKHKKPATPIIHWTQAWLPPQSSVPQEQPDFFDPAKLYTGLSPRAAAALAAYRNEFGERTQTGDK